MCMWQLRSCAAAQLSVVWMCCWCLVNTDERHACMVGSAALAGPYAAACMHQLWTRCSMMCLLVLDASRIDHNGRASWLREGAGAVATGSATVVY